VLRLTADDGQYTVFDEVTVGVQAPSGGGGGATIVERRVAAGSDDAEQASSGSVSLSSSDLELVTDGSTVQTVGVRFANLAVPKGATITSAYVQFTADEVSTGAASLTIRAEASDNAGTFTSVSGGVTSRATTTAAVGWSPADWPTIGQAGAAQRTSDISALVGAVVGRAGWASGNALALHFTGTGRRTAEAFEGGASLAPLLHVEYSTGGGGGPVNQPPTVNAGNDFSVTLPATASLDGTVTDDGAVTTMWSQVSGPGTVAFGNTAAVDTTAAFSEAGSYVLRLTADDGQYTVFDEVTVGVQAPSGGGGGTVQTFEVRVAAGSDDAEQRLSGATDLASTDLELTTDGSTQQVVGMRFANVQIPVGATVTKAYVQFTADEVSTGVASLTIRAEASDDAPTYQATSGNVTSRTPTTTSVAWSPLDWSTVGAAGEAQRTPDIAALVSAVVGRPGWASGNALALQVSGTGRRTAEAFEGGVSLAPLLHVEYTVG
jgi:hypothetical protein